MPTSEALDLATIGEGSIPAGAGDGELEQQLLDESGQPISPLQSADGTVLVDPDGDGIIEPTDLNGDGTIDLQDADGDGIVDPIDLDGDGIIDALDRDGDGRLDSGDIDGDGTLDPIDLDGDGIPDVLPTAETALYATQQALEEVQAEAARISAERLVVAEAAEAELVAPAEVAGEALDRAETEAARVERELATATARHAQLSKQLAAAEDVEVRHAVNSYVANSAVSVSLLTSTDPSELAARRVYSTALLRADRGEIEELTNELREVAATVAELQAEQGQALGQLSDAVERKSTADDALAAARVQVAVYAGGSEHAVPGFVFPVGAPYQFIDSFGFPRMMGTSYAHWHEGADIFAPMGTPLFAVEDGRIDNFGVGNLGGNKFWIVGESGTEYYYAHLSAFADGIGEGVPVTAGQVVGYVGDTGNARGTPPHLHFEIHPDGGDAINPYSILAAAARVEQHGRGVEVAGAAPSLARTPRPDSESDSSDPSDPSDPSGESDATPAGNNESRDPEELRQAAIELMGRLDTPEGLVVGGPVFSDPSKPETNPTSTSSTATTESNTEESDSNEAPPADDPN